MDGERTERPVDGQERVETRLDDVACEVEDKT